MASFTIKGGCRLSGSISPQGAKNEALQIISACLLTSEKLIVKNLPIIRDVLKLIDILKSLGVEVECIDEHTYSFQASNVNTDYVFNQEFVVKTNALRGSVMLAGPFLARFNFAQLPQPGGDKIGRRKLDTHLLGFEKLGANVSYNDYTRCFSISTQGLKGGYVLLDEASVTGTANIVMAAVLAEGETTIFNAACEPYIYQLCTMLVRMGAIIDGIGSNLLKIKGVDSLVGTEHCLLPDMIEVGSFIGMAAMTRSELTINNVSFQHLGLIPNVFKRLGIYIEERGDNLYIPKQEFYEVENSKDRSILTISDAPWPGFTPDLISIALVTAIQAKGSVLIHQKMFESRLFFVDNLISMGAQIILCDPHRAVVIGYNHQISLRGISMVSPDIRAGVALLIAAMSAEGTSVIDNVEQIDRGYEKIDVRLNALGADITRAS